MLTGATGNLGSNVSRALISAGESVRVLVMAGDPALDRLPAEAEVCPGDVLDHPSLERFFDVPFDTDTYVIHCAAIVSLEAEFSKKVHDVNVVGTQNILDLCVKHRVKKLVYISSTGAIPELPHGQPIVEVDHYDPDRVIGYYGKSKAMASQRVMDAVSRHGLDASIVFPTGIFGPYDYGFGLVTSNIIQFARGKIPVGLTGSFNCADVRDLAAGVIACCSHGKMGEGYIMGNRTVTVKELFDMIADICACKRVSWVLPAGFAQVAAVFSEAFAKVTGRPTILTRFTIYNLVRNNDFSSAKAMNELGYQSRPFAETIRDEVAWLREIGKL